MPVKTCSKCGKEYTDPSNYRKHLARKTPCAPILEKEDLPEEQRDNPNRCKYCGRAFGRHSDMVTHVKKTCKIVPRNGDTSGMEKLYEHTIRKMEAKQQSDEARIKALEAQVNALTGVATGYEQGAAPAALISRAVGHVTPHAAPITKAIQNNVVTNVGAGGTLNVDNSTGKTINNVNINISIFGQENLGRITKPQVVDLLRGLGPVGENVKAIAEKAIIQAAMLIFSDPAHPEDITCYLPNKKGDDALVHSESGWEVQPVGLVISPMAAQSIEVLFKHQPAPDQHTPENDVKWMMEECGNILRYIQKHEGDMTNDPPRGELRGILIRNKEILQQVLAKLPMASPARRGL
jgi:DNA-directed RNA polymerase subunit RPC12/RpoP